MKHFVVFLSLVAATLAAPQLVGPHVYNDINGRIVGGVEATPHSAPYIISIRVGAAGNHNCGGVLLNPNNVLTAAHCASALGTTQLVAGAHDTQTDAAGTQRRTLARIISHPGYPGGNQVAPHDIAIFIPNLPFDLTDTVNIAVLPSPGHPTGSITLHGWGSTSNTQFPSMPRFLQTVDKPIIPMAQCLVIPRMVGTPLDAVANLCTGPLDSNVDACGGDSGGPLVQGSGTGAIVVGVVSWGWFPCGNGPSVATNVGSYIAWINENLV